MEYSPLAHRLRQRWTWRADRPTISPAISLLISGVSCKSRAKRKRWTACTEAVRCRTVRRASCKKASGKIQATGLGPGMSGVLSDSVFLAPLSSLPRVRGNYDVICETDHLASGAICAVRAFARVASVPFRTASGVRVVGVPSFPLLPLRALIRPGMRTGGSPASGSRARRGSQVGCESGQVGVPTLLAPSTQMTIRPAVTS
jgi:hypothetical protein